MKTVVQEFGSVRPQLAFVISRLANAVLMTGLAALAAATGVAQPSLADLITYTETAPGSGVYNLTLTNTNTADNIGTLTLNYSAISPTYVDDFVQGTPIFIGGNHTWEYVLSTSGTLFFRAEDNDPFNYLAPGQSATFQITHQTPYVGTAQAQAQVGTVGSGNQFQNFDAPSYDSVQPGTGVIVNVAMSGGFPMISISNSPSASTVTVQRCEDLLSTNWLNLTNLTLGVTNLTDTSATGDWRSLFYRTVQE